MQSSDWRFPGDSNLKQTLVYSFCISGMITVKYGKENLSKSFPSPQLPDFREQSQFYAVKKWNVVDRV